MRDVVKSALLSTLLMMVISAAGWAQGPGAPQAPKKSEPSVKPQLGPSTTPTKEEAENAAKAPTGLAPVVTAAPVDPKTYIIGPEDILFIRVWREAELSGGVQVRPDGKFTLPLVGEVQAAGLTPEQVTAKLTESLSSFINKPEVVVSLQSVQSKKYYITGEVARTGIFPLVVPITILEALASAGGFKEYANPKKIVIMRGDERIKFNYKDVIKGKNKEQNIMIQNGDHIFVP
ncbi:MAG TPA: polysaccharide biosynthesis/export family protein [Bryobacteraceae bacterium]|nr:polysaccharide biosynthesis/export family protein [Bryobacteraceae bacterium]